MASRRDVWKTAGAFAAFLSAFDARPSSGFSLFGNDAEKEADKDDFQAALVAKNFRLIDDFFHLRSSDDDDTAAFSGAAASGEIVLVPDRGGRSYNIHGKIEDPGGSRMIGVGVPILAVHHSKMFLQLKGIRSEWSNFAVHPVQEGTEYGLEIAEESYENTLRNIEFVNGNSGIKVRGPRNSLSSIRFYEMRGTCMRIDGTGAMHNNVFDLSIRNGALAGLLLENGASFNYVSNARKWVDVRYFTPFLSQQRGADEGKLGGDVCALTIEAHHNQFFQLECSDTRDGCFTLSGNDNVLVGASFQGSQASGCNVSGSRNKISNVQVSSCKTGFRVTPQAGGIGKDNVFVACQADNNREYGFRHDRNSYRVWEPNITKEPRTHFCTYEGNVYQCNQATEVFGDKPPIHTEGVASDGVVEWIWVSGDAKTLDADRTTVLASTSSGSGLDDWVAFGSGTMTRIGCPGVEAVSVVEVTTAKERNSKK